MTRCNYNSKSCLHSYIKPYSYQIVGQNSKFTYEMVSSNFLNKFCKVEFIQLSNWLYSVPNLLVIQHLVTLYLGGFDVRVVSERE